MTIATLLIVILSNQGYWFGGQEGTITIREAARGGLPAANLSWEMTFDHVRIGNGSFALNPGDGGTVTKIAVPQCRERISLHWNYRVVERTTGKELDHGDIPLQVFPNDLLSGLAERVGKKRLVVWDGIQGIPGVLDNAKVPYRRIDSESPLQFAKSDVVLVGKQVIGTSAFSQGPLAALVEAGASVMIFEQDLPDRLMGYTLSKRKAPAELQWRTGHPLLRDLSAEDLQSWAAATSPLSVVQLPADEPVLELGYYPPEAPALHARPVDAVLLTKTVGSGRLVLCQIPLGNWNQDPRSQIFLKNAIDYLLTRPQPTPRFTDRHIVPPAELPEVPTIPLSRGNQP